MSVALLWLAVPTANERVPPTASNAQCTMTPVHTALTSYIFTLPYSQLQGEDTRHSVAQHLRQSLALSDIVRTQYVPIDDDSDSSDMEMEVHLMRKYGIK